MRRIFYSLYSILALSLFSQVLSAQDDKYFSSLADRVFSLAEEQYIQLDSEVSSHRAPRYYDPKEKLFQDSDLSWWCSGFYPASLWYIYMYTGNDAVKEIAQRRTLELSSLLETQTDHDIGFQIGCPFGNAFKATGDTFYLASIKEAATKLSGRYSHKVKAIKSWDFLRPGWDYPVIIDNLMNLELLCLASDQFSEESFRDIAVSHAKTTMRNHFRDDFSTYHLVNYSSEDGTVLSKETVQGYSDESMWSRGEAWALYGYTMMYENTGQKQFLLQAENIADLLLERLPEDGIPYWDFDSINIPKDYRDASAAAIMASAFVRLSSFCEDSTKSFLYLKMAKTQIRNLCSGQYLSEADENHGFLLSHSVGNFPQGSEVDVSLTYADYYLLEALFRISGRT